MSPSKLEHQLCTWPNGESRRVTVVARLPDGVRVLWIDKVEKAKFLGKPINQRMSFTEVVPERWLSEATKS